MTSDDGDQAPAGALPRTSLARLFSALPSFEKEMLALRRFIGRGDVCVDVGASYGLYAVWLGRLVGPRGTVHAFEPRPRSRRVLEATRRLAPRNVRVHPLALSDTNGYETLVTPRRRWYLPVPGRSFLKGTLEGGPAGYHEGWIDEFGGSEEHPIATQTLDLFAERHELGRLRFVKVDVEGAELRVLRGAEATLKEHRPVVLCELEDRHTRKYGHPARAVTDWLADRGYRAHVFDGLGLTPAATVARGENNYLFLPEELAAMR